MKHFYQRVILSMLFCMAGLTASAYDCEVDGIYYNLSGNEAIVTYKVEYTASYSDNIIIPSSIVYNGNSYSVTSIGKKAFYNCSGLTSVTIPNSVRNIGYSAFTNCSGLTSVTIPNSVTTIEKYAFYGCSGLTSITIGNSVTSIGESAFYKCNDLKKVIASDIAAWCNISFDNNASNPLWLAEHLYSDEETEITNLTIPYTVTTIKNYTFYGCSGLTSVAIPNSVTTIEKYAFYNCSGLTSVTIPNSVTSIGSSAFSSCRSLTSVTLNSNAIVSKNYTNNSSLKDVFSSQVKEYILGEQVTGIGSYAFSGCSNLPSIIIPNSVTTIGNDAFSGCSSLTSVTLNSNAVVSKNYKKSSLKDVFGSQVKEYILGEQVTSIGDCAFSGCGIDAVTIPNSVTIIGHLAFERCSGLSSVTIPNSVATIGQYAFRHCSGLTSITIGNSVASIGMSAFSDCSGLKKVIVPDIAAWCNISFDNNASNPLWLAEHLYSDEETEITNLTIPYTVTTIKNYTFYGCSGLTSVAIPNSVTTIGDDAFKSCSGLISVTIPNSVTTIEKYAFRNCSGLTSITIGNSVSSIGDYTFSGCSGLTSITIPNSVTSIGDNAFSDCSGLTSVTIPNSVTSIGGSVFTGCSSLTSITLNSNVIVSKAYKDDSNLKNIFGAQVKEYILGEQVTGIGDYAFFECDSLTSITIPNNVTSIGESAFYKCNGLTSATLNSNAIVSKTYSTSKNLKNIFGEQVKEYILGEQVTSIGDYVFYGCRSMTSVTIPNSVTTIGRSAFYGCSGLTSMSIPNSVTTIGNNAFYQCSGLTSISIPNSVTSIGDYAFYSCSGLTSVIIPNTITTIKNYTFYGCSGLTSITIGNSVTSIGESAFYKCNALKKVIVPDIAAWCKITFDNLSSNPLYYAKHLYSDEETEITELTIPNSVTSIGARAFQYCSGLTSVTIPNSVTTIGDDAFYNCSGLISVTIPNSVTTIGNYAFAYCSGLTSVTIPNSMTNIGDYAFTGCKDAIISVFDNLTVIGTDAFKNCNKVMCNSGTRSLLVLWKSGYVPYQIGSDIMLTPPTISVLSSTQTTASFKINNKHDGYIYYLLAGSYKLIEGTKGTLTGLTAGKENSVSLGVDIANEGIRYKYIYQSPSVSYTTKPISPTIKLVSKTASSITVEGSYIEGDAVVDFAELSIGGIKSDGSEITAKGLFPNQSYTATYIIKENGHTYEYKGYFYTDNLTLKTLQPKVISVGNVIVAAESNLDDEETNVGFEWRRTDWTDDFTSNTGRAYLYEGTMEGYIRNLNADKLWKVRPYYMSDSGNYYYGDWIGLDPSNTSYFEPTVHTYAKTTVNGNTVSVKGYAMRGSDNVTQQGFKYWKQTASARAEAPAHINVPSNAKTVEASGQMMTADLTGLEYDSQYCFVAFMTTSEGETFYGEQQTFTTGKNTSGVENAETTREPATVVARYDMSGRRIEAPQLGLNILRMSDGSVKKVMVK